MPAQSVKELIAYVPPILAGKLRALAVTSTTRWYELSDVPTMTDPKV